MTSTESRDPGRQLANYYPAWLDNLADDVALEGSMMDGVVPGAEAVRTVIGEEAAITMKQAADDVQSVVIPAAATTASRRPSRRCWPR
jgi:hypothetical protein